LLTAGGWAAVVVGGGVVAGGVVVTGGVVVPGAVVTGGVVTGGVVTGGVVSGGGPPLSWGGFGPLSSPLARPAGAATARARMSTDVATPMLRRRRGLRR
jgi:hypothetical protein